MRLTRIDKNSWIVGLEWYVPPMDASVQEIREYVEGEQADCIVRRGNQIGFGLSGGNSELLTHRSLAAWLSVPVNSFIGIFRLKDHLNGEGFWWLFARINGNIMSGFGDVVFETREEASKARDELLDLLPPNTVIDEDIWLETEQESLNWLRLRCEVPFTAKVAGQAVVKPVESFKSGRNDLVKNVLLGVFGLSILIAGGLYAHDFLTDMGMTAKARQQAQERDRQRRELEEHPEKLFTQKWLSYPNGALASDMCFRSIDKTSLVYAGWKLAFVECAMGENSGSIRTAWSHTPLASYHSLPGDAQIGGKGAQARQFSMKRSLDWGLAPMKGPQHGQLPTQNRIQRDFLEIAQNYGVKTRVVFSKPEKKTVKDLGTFTCPWVKGTFSIQAAGSVQVVGLCALLGKIPALAVTRIEYDLSKWEIRGDIYAL